MKRNIVIGLVICLVIGIISCQRESGTGISSLETNLKTSVAEITGINISKITSSAEQGVSVELFNGHSSAFVISGECHMGQFGLPGWSFSEADHLKFGVPHIDSCVNVSVSSSTYPREIIIEFLKGCSTHRHDKSGKIIINLSDTITNEGAVQTIEYQDFYIDSIKIDLSATLKNLGKNDSGNWVIEKEYVMKITKNDDVAVRENTETLEWISGFETAEKSDNVYYLSGSGSIVLNDSAVYSKNITTPLLFDASCEFITSGVVELTRNANVTIIDYGDGTCDDKATITTNGTTEEINLHSNKFMEGGQFGNHCGGFGHNHGYGGGQGYGGHGHGGHGH
jgi:hypothetical protein